MNPVSIDLFWLIIILVVINFSLIVIIRTENRFFHPPILLWLGLFFTLILLHVGYGYTIEQQQAVYEYSMADDSYGDALLWNRLQEIKHEELVLKSKTMRLLGAQSFMALVLLTIGYKQTGRLMYRKAALTFVGICLLYIVVELVRMFTSGNI